MSRRNLFCHSALRIPVYFSCGMATATLQDLQAKTGVAHTGTGSVLPISDVLRMAAHAHNFLLLFDNAKRCQLYKGRDARLATPAQRLVLYANAK